VIARILSKNELAKARVSILVVPLGASNEKDPLVSRDADVRRVPASNAKMMTTAAALKLLSGKSRFTTELLRRGRYVYLRGHGDPLLAGRDLRALARAARAKGLRSLSEVRVDDSHYHRRFLAPGFERFLPGARYRPTVGALNVDRNAVRVIVTPVKNRRRPRVDVLPPSDYVKVEKLVRYAKRERRKSARARLRKSRRPTRARRSRGKTHPRLGVTLAMRPRGSLLWLTIGGRVARDAKPWRVSRAVYDPALNAGWAMRRALKQAGVNVRGTVRRGRAPRGARVLAKRHHSLFSVIRAANTHSDNLAAEVLVREVASRQGAKRKGSWKVGLARIHAALARLGVKGIALKNGSGLHRGTRLTARSIVSLLLAAHRDPYLRRAWIPTLAVAGRTGTLAPRMRRSVARGRIRAKTGTLGGVLALSGYAGLQGRRPLAFSILVNGTGRRSARRRIDEIAEVLVRYAYALPLEQPAEPQSQPASLPLSARRLPRLPGFAAAKGLPVPIGTARDDAAKRSTDVKIAPLGPVPLAAR
jgi:D-alanyl-D-alanine carboxypeptidase/D-alanyl-D-alanine-endopeptidase (penicillin-binding protein 4)